MLQSDVELRFPSKSSANVRLVKQNAKEYQTVVLAALLHDVGKLLGHGHFLPLNKGQHPRFSAKFVEAFPEVFAAVSVFYLFLNPLHHSAEVKLVFCGKDS